jgi:hypothetical protein
MNLSSKMRFSKFSNKTQALTETEKNVNVIMNELNTLFYYSVTYQYKTFHTSVHV